VFAARRHGTGAAPAPHNGPQLSLVATRGFTMKRLAVLTSGGDAPGMNAAIRAAVRVGISRGYEMHGVRHGYRGLLEGRFVTLGLRDVGGIMERGGTVLGTARCAALKSEAGQAEAVRQLAARGIEGLVVIGGNGSQSGARALSARGVRVAGVASTIDNDLVGSDLTIGATTAVDVALESVDRLRVTASSIGRVFLVEVMGRDCGYIATAVGIASGAEVIVTPEAPQSPEDVAALIRAAYDRGKSHAIAVVAEGAARGVDALAGHFQAHSERLGFDLRVCRLGHVQRGGAPGVTDRLLATRLAAAAVEQLDRGASGVLMGQLGGKVHATPLEEVAGRTKPADDQLVALAQVLAR
jgi:6-phosphofructokinase 1